MNAATEITRTSAALVGGSACYIISVPPRCERGCTARFWPPNGPVHIACGNPPLAVNRKTVGAISEAHCAIWRLATKRSGKRVGWVERSETHRLAAAEV